MGKKRSKEQNKLRNALLVKYWSKQENRKKMSDIKNKLYENNIELIERLGGKKVQQLDINNNVINEYISLRNAFKQTGIFNIPSVCNGNRPSAGGYKWKFK